MQCEAASEALPLGVALPQRLISKITFVLQTLDYVAPSALFH
jgi:hypothetical protein